MKQLKKACVLFFCAVILTVFSGVSELAAPAYAASAHWVYKGKNKVGYVLKSGERVKGGRKIGSKIYFFDNKGKLSKAGSERRLKWKGDYYDVRKDGTIRKGWQVFGSSLYYFGGKNGAMTRNKTVDNIHLLASGKAYMTLDASIRYKCIKKLKSWGVQDKSKKKQLKKAWKYVSGRSFHYATIYPKLSDKRWTKKYANKMLSSHKGNCYGFACTFAAFAWVIGYDPYVVCGRCAGGRDHAADGFTRHAIVKISGKYYDPEGQFAGWLRGVYGKKSYNYPFKKKFSVRMKRVNGNIKTSKATMPKNSVQCIDGRYYYFNAKKKSVKGMYLIKGKLYNFNKKGKYGYYMTTKAYNKWQARGKQNAPFAPLKKLIGNPKKVTTADSCYMGSGKDCINKYKHFIVDTFLPDDGGEEIIIGLRTE